MINRKIISTSVLSFAFLVVGGSATASIIFDSNNITTNSTLSLLGGNVGIGTASPTALLTVNGSALISGTFTTTGQQLLNGGTNSSSAQVFAGPPSANTGIYGFSIVPTEASASKFNLVGASYTNAGDTRTNQVFRLGANVSPNCLQNNADGGIFDTWESHYAPDATRNVERHISFSPANCATETRLWTAMVNKSTGVAVIGSVADRWLWTKRSDSSLFMDLNVTGNSFLRSNFDIGVSTAGSSGQTLSVFNQLGTTNVLIKEGAVSNGPIFTIANNTAVPKFYVDASFDVYSTGSLNAASMSIIGDAFSGSWITAGYGISLRGDGSLNIRNSAGSGGISFTSGTHEYDTHDTKIVRGAAGLIAITDGSDGPGSAGTYRDIQLRALNPSTGNVGIGTTSPNAKLDINSDSFILETAKTPSSASASCTTGMIAWDTNFTYVCVATNTWKRSALTTW